MTPERNEHEKRNERENNPGESIRDGIPGNNAGNPVPYSHPETSTTNAAPGEDYKNMEPENAGEDLLPDDYTDLSDGNANTDSDKTFGDFVYEQHKAGRKTQNVRRAVVEDQTDPPPFPENTADPQTAPEDMELQKGTRRHREDTLPPLRQKIDEAEAILAARTRENEARSEDRDDRHTQRHSR